MEPFSHCITMGDVNLRAERIWSETKGWQISLVANCSHYSSDTLFSLDALEEERKIETSEHNGFRFKAKLMDNGELRLSVHKKSKGWHTITIASDWTEYTPELWQQPHLHRDLIEHYVVESGWMLCVWGDHWEADWFGGLYGFGHECSNVDVPSGTDHNVLLKPGAVIGTWQTQVGISDCKWPIVERANPDRNNSNWWSTDPARWSNEMDARTRSVEGLAAWLNCDVAELM